MLTRANLMGLEDYDQARSNFRSKVMQHKKTRRVFIGEHAVIHFESRLSMQYQVQEMLRVERIFTAQGIQEELDTYNPLIPDGKNWKGTFMLEYPDIEERRIQVTKLIGIEHRIWIQIAGCDKVFAIADEDMDRANDEKTSTVHFIRFQLTDAMCQAVKNSADIAVGVDHHAYSEHIDALPDNIRASLAGDIQLDS